MVERTLQEFGPWAADRDPRGSQRHGAPSPSRRRWNPVPDARREARDCRQYCIVRDIPATATSPDPHVDPNARSVDSLFVFLGRGPDMQGLTVEVRVGDTTAMVTSPRAVFIPAGMVHTYRIVSGEGFFINHVLAGSYNESLLEQSNA